MIEEKEDLEPYSPQWMARLVFETAHDLINGTLDEDMLREFEREIRALSWHSDARLDELKLRRIRNEQRRKLTAVQDDWRLQRKEGSD